MERSKSDGREYMVQYFERNRLELHPELAGTAYEVQLGLLGSELLDLQGGPAAFANKGQPHSYPAPASAGSNIPPGEIITPPGSGTPGTAGPPEPPPAPALPASTAAVLLQADFASSDLSAWEELAPMAAEGGTPAAWRASSGRLEQTGVASDDGSDDAAVLVTRVRTFSNFTMDAYVYASSGEPVGAVFRYSDAGFYILRL
jgi:hypothetical protein